MNKNYNFNIKNNGFFLLLVAAGLGKRCDSKTPKQYLKINNTTIIEHTINFFLSNFKKIYIQPIISKKNFSDYSQSVKKNITNKMLLEPIVGGKERKNSVFNGLQHIAKYNPRFVMIHDAVRIINSKTLVIKMIEKLKNDNCYAVAPVVPIYDTIRYINENNFITKNRKKMFCTQTPQCFVFEKIFNLYNKKTNFENQMTDEISFFENSDLKVNFVCGDKLNIKITDKKDIEIAKKIFKIREIFDS